MGGHISFGKYNSYYKYILFYIISRLFEQYSFQKDFIEKLNLFDRTIIFDHKIIQEMCNYIGIFLFSSLLFIYSNFNQKEKKKNKDDSLSNKSDIFLYDTKFIYKVEHIKENISFIKIILIIFLLVLERQ